MMEIQRITERTYDRWRQEIENGSHSVNEYSYATVVNCRPGLFRSWRQALRALFVWVGGFLFFCAALYLIVRC